MTRRLPWFVIVLAVMLAAAAGVTCNANRNTATSSGTAGNGAGGSSGDAGQSGAGGLIGGGGPGGFGGTTGAGGSKPGDCDVSCMAAGGVCQSGVCTIVENPGNVAPGDQTTLEGGGNNDPGFTWLYPYDKTVFPRGLKAPLLQFGGSASSAMLVHVTFSGMDYKGFFSTMNPPQARISDASWKAITFAAKGNDQVKVDVAKLSGGQVVTAVQQTWKIAQGSLRGTIYYETYNSTLAGLVGIMKLSPGAAQPTVLKTGCGNVCHTASADGSTLVAATQFPFGSASYDLKNNAATIAGSGGNEFVYGGIYPDGSFVISSTNYRTWLGGASRLYDTKTVQQIPTPSWDNAVTNAAMPAFSPDGKWVTFNREDKGGGRSLARMAYDHASNTFSGLEDVISDPSLYLGWPAFTPDSNWIVYHAGSNDLFETDSGAAGDLYVVNAKTHVKARMDLVDGYAGGATYLPEKDPNLNFAPTVLPVAVGGYFWTVFTSHRSYGNTFPSQKNGDQDGQLWVAAIDLNPSDGADPSHPAFYLEGQEDIADNLRGFWVLDPCKEDGNDCTGGDECCGGFCQKDANGNYTCSPVSNGCSQELDKCTTAADCCDQPSECINGHCAGIVPQ